jgi:hypothetical protein
MKPVISFIIILIFISSSVNAQVDRDGFQKVDEYVSKLGSMDGHGPRDIIDSFNAARFDELSLVRGIYDWIGLNIAFDCKAFHHPAQANHTASGVMMTRKATTEGYANLFQLMCGLARISCVTIKGYSKWNFRNR